MRAHVGPKGPYVGPRRLPEPPWGPTGPTEARQRPLWGPCGPMHIEQFLRLGTEGTAVKPGFAGVVGKGGASQFFGSRLKGTYLFV